MTRPPQADPAPAAGGSETPSEELRRYATARFPPADDELAAVTPLPDEPFVDCWRGWAEEAATDGAWAVLRRHLPQLAFPIRDGISTEDDYRAATLSGVSTERLATATGLELERPETLELRLHAGFAGTVPLLVARHRPDFVALVRALARRNEPYPIPPSQGAVTVAGFNNWARIRTLREAWETRDPTTRDTATWAEEFARIRVSKPLYQDRFIILSDGPYSDVPAADMGLDDASWRERSLIIRREHECAHYYTRRVYGLMRNHLADELIADYTGLTAATGRFRAADFLRFVGLEDHPRYRPGGRLDLYRGDPPLGDDAFRALRRLVYAAAHGLEAWDRDAYGERPRDAGEQTRAIRAVAALSLLELAGDDAPERLHALDPGLP